MDATRADADHADAAADIQAACRRMVADGLVIGSAGNISVRVGGDRAIVTAGGVGYEQLSAADHPVVALGDGSWTGPRAPTSELALHLAVLRAMPSVGAVVHTHSRFAAAFAVARLDLPFICNENMATRADRVLVTPYAPPGTTELGTHVLSTFARQPGSRAVLLANHGVVAIGPDLTTAELVARSVEWTAEICHHARTLLAAGTTGATEHRLDAAVQAAMARTYGITLAAPPPP